MIIIYIGGIIRPLQEVEFLFAGWVNIDQNRSTCIIIGHKGLKWRNKGLTSEKNCKHLLWALFVYFKSVMRIFQLIVMPFYIVLLCVTYYGKQVQQIPMFFRLLQFYSHRWKCAQSPPVRPADVLLEPKPDWW